MVFPANSPILRYRSLLEIRLEQKVIYSILFALMEEVLRDGNAVPNSYCLVLIHTSFTLIINTIGLGKLTGIVYLKRVRIACEIAWAFPITFVL